MDVVRLSEIDGARRQALTGLLQRADAADDHPPLPEPQYHAVVDDGGAGAEVHDGRLVLAEVDGGLAGFALLTPA